MNLKQRLRLAGYLHECWQMQETHRQAAMEPVTTLLQGYWLRLRQSEKTWSLARENGLELILPRLEEAVSKHASILSVAIQDLDGSYWPPRRTWSLRDFKDELHQLEAEFHGFSFDGSKRLLSVTTEPIELQGITLGEFTLQCSIEQWLDSEDLVCFRVIAEDPNTPENNESITHPHVREQEVCLGDAEVTVRRAMLDGRLADAFLLIRSVLMEYNPDSAYVRLNEWSGSPCYECGLLVAQEETMFCDKCHHDYCAKCSYRCTVCDVDRCMNCFELCQECLEHCCRSCSSISSTSKKRFCKHCQQVCRVCHTKVCPDEWEPGSACCQECEEVETKSEENDHEDALLTASA